jgi:succinate dehydrogenase / fumarate reductase cytochrome b subunit
MFILIPLVLYLLDRSLGSPDAFAGMVAFAGHPLVKLVLLGLLWAFLHHLCAGIRFLLLDVHVGSDLAAARSSSAAVLVVSLVLTAILGVKLW